MSNGVSWLQLGLRYPGLVYTAIDIAALWRASERRPRVSLFDSGQTVLRLRGEGRDCFGGRAYFIADEVYEGRGAKLVLVNDGRARPMSFRAP